MLTKPIQRNHTVEHVSGEETFKCLKCGSCCRALFVFVGPDDLKREPRLRKAVSRLKNRPDEQERFGQYSNKYLLVAGWAIPCPFIGADNLCTIHQTKPDICRKWQPNEHSCRQMREKLRKNCPDHQQQAEISE